MMNYTNIIHAHLPLCVLFQWNSLNWNVLNFWKKQLEDSNTSNQNCSDAFATPKTNMDTQNDGLEKVIPFKYGHFGYLC